MPRTGGRGIQVGLCNFTAQLCQAQCRLAAGISGYRTYLPVLLIKQCPDNATPLSASRSKYRDNRFPIGGLLARGALVNLQSAIGQFAWHSYLPHWRPRPYGICGTTSCRPAGASTNLPSAFAYCSGYWPAQTAARSGIVLWIDIVAGVHSGLDMCLIPVNANQLIGIQVSGRVKPWQELPRRHFDVLPGRQGAIDIEHFCLQVEGIRQYGGNQIPVASIESLGVSIQAGLKSTPCR